MASSSAPLLRARQRKLFWARVTDRSSHCRVDNGRSLRQQEIFRTASGSLLTTSRTVPAAQDQSWNAWAQCSVCLIITARWASNAVPMLFVPTALSDQLNQGARPPALATERVYLSPQEVRILPLESAMVTTPPASATS